MVDQTFTYVTYIESTPEAAWRALTDPLLTADYWGHSNVSDWRPGSRWEHRRTDGSGIADVAGTVIEAVPPKRLVMTFGPPQPDPAVEPSVVRFEIMPYRDIIRLTMTNERIATRNEYEAAEAGWPTVLANLKTLLETGHTLPQPPWEMHAEQRAAQMARSNPG